MKTTAYKDFYWYAKHWYEDTDDVKEDLVALAREYSGTPSTIRDALIILSHAVEEYIYNVSANPRHEHSVLLNNIFKGIVSDTGLDGWIDAHLSILSLAHLPSDADGTMLEYIGAPSNCIPLGENYYKKYVDGGEIK